MPQSSNAARGSASASDDPGPQSDDPSPRSRSAVEDRAAHASLEVACAPGAALPADDLRWLEAHAAAALTHLGVAGELRVRVVNDDEMAAAHLQHCGEPGTTDVITFDLIGTDGSTNTLDADLLICVDEATRQADKRGHAVARELLLYLVHGVLHCLGEDDRDESAWRRMHAREDEILAAIGVGATFADRETERTR